MAIGRLLVEKPVISMAIHNLYLDGALLLGERVLENHWTCVFPKDAPIRDPPRFHLTGITKGQLVQCY